MCANSYCRLPFRALSMDTTNPVSLDLLLALIMGCRRLWCSLKTIWLFLERGAGIKGRRSLLFFFYVSLLNQRFMIYRTGLQYIHSYYKKSKHRNKDLDCVALYCT